MGIFEIIPIIVTLIETIKRFIPDKHRTWANPVIAGGLGLGITYAQGGVPALLDGLIAGAGAIGVYKIPKMIGAKIINEDGNKEDSSVS